MCYWYLQWICVGYSFERKKKDITIINAFQKSLHETNRNPNKVWAEKGNGFYNKSMILWLQGNDMELYSAYKGKSYVAERFIRTLKNKICKYMALVSENVYIDKLGEIVNKYNNKHQSTINIIACWCKFKHIYYLKNNKENPKFEVIDEVRISKYKN